MIYRMGWLGSCLLAVLMMTPAQAQLNARRTLHGLNTVKMVIGQLHPDVERRGLSSAMLHKDVAQKLQQAGIQVLTEEEWQRNPEQPVLSLTVGTTPLESFPIYSVLIKLQLRQSACLTRNLIICEPVITWEDTSDVREVSVSRLAAVQQDIRTMIDRFLDAYSAENRQ